MNTSSYSQSLSIKRSGVKSGFVMLFIVFITAIILGLIVVAAQQLKNHSRKDLQRELSAVLTTTRGALALWMENVRADQELLVQLPVVHRTLEGDVTKSYESVIEKAFTPWFEGRRYLGYAIFKKDKKGDHLVLKKGIKWHDLLEKSRPLLEKAFEGNFLIGKPMIYDSRDVISLSVSPIKDSQGTTIGVLCVVIDLLTRFTEATHLGRMGDSGETYVINSKGQMITPSRFKADPFEKGMVARHPLFLQKDHAFSNKVSYNLEGYDDYRGVPVIGAWTWDDDLDLGLITELDKAEAYRSYSTTQNLVWFLGFIILLGMGSLLFLREMLTRNTIKHLKLLEESRKELLSVVSHDLKNPLTSLLMTNEILLRNLSRTPDAFTKNRQLLEKNLRAAEQMKKLVNDLLDSSRIEAGKMEVHPVECDGGLILHQNIEMLEPTATAKQITLKLEVPADLPHLQADPDRLSQVFSNILGNAVKFTPSGGQITVASQVVDELIQFSITDTGPGIPAEEQPFLFDRFWQANQTRRLGTGLGLAISKELVLAHGGEIWVDSEFGKGSTFHFVIPRWPK